MDVIYLILKLNESKKNQKMQFVIALNVLNVILFLCFDMFFSAKCAIISIVADIIQYFN